MHAIFRKKRDGEGSKIQTRIIPFLQFARVGQVLFCFLFLLGVTGCASLRLETPQTNARRGFFDQLAEWQPSHGKVQGKGESRSEGVRADRGGGGNSKRAVLIANTDHIHGVAGLQ